MKDCTLADTSITINGNDPWFHISNPIEAGILMFQGHGITFLLFTLFLI